MNTPEKSNNLLEIEDKVKNTIASFYGDDLSDCDYSEFLMAILEYARDEIKERFYEAEILILQDLHIAYVYASEVMQCRWPEAETLFITSVVSGDEYALFVAFEYCMEVIQNNWIEMEPYFLADPYYKIVYPAFLQYQKIINNGEFALIMLPDREWLAQQVSAGIDPYSDIYDRAKKLEQNVRGWVTN